MLRLLRAACLRAEAALLRQHAEEWEADLKRLPGAIAEYHRRAVELEVRARDLEKRGGSRWQTSRRGIM